MKKVLMISFSVILVSSLIFLLYPKFIDAKRKADLIKRLNSSPISEVRTTKLDDLQDGDILFQKSLSPESRIVELATKSVYTHCGIYFKIADIKYVFEVSDKVKLTSLIEWMGNGKSGEFKIKRLRNSEMILTPRVKNKMIAVRDRCKGKDNDEFLEWSDDKFYSSELIWKIYKESTGLEIGGLQKFSSLEFADKVVFAKMYLKYGDKFPMDEVVITPDSIFHSSNLTTVELRSAAY